MSATPASATRVRLGIVLDGTLLTAVWRSATSGPLTEALNWRTLVVPCDGTARSIAEALQQIAERTQARGEVAFVVQRPLAAARSIGLPKMSRHELEAVLERDWARYVIGLRAEPHVAAVASQARGATWRAAFAPAATLEALETSAREHGWTVRDIRTTDDALAAAGREAMPTIVRMDDAIVALCGATSATDIVRLRRGAPVAGRQLLRGTAAEIVSFVRSSSSADRAAPRTEAGLPTIVLLGDRERGDTLARELGADGLQAHFVPSTTLASDSPTTMLATAALLHPARLTLVAPSERIARSARARTTTRWLVAATIALAAAGLAIENHRVQSALEDTARQRAAISARVSDAVARRANLESATDAVSALASYEAQASHASAAVASIALAVPENASVSVLQVAGDSVTIEGESDRSAEVYAALRAAPMLDAVRLAGPLRQERQADDAPVEHFSFVARLRKVTR